MKTNNIKMIIKHIMEYHLKNICQKAFPSLLFGLKTIDKRYIVLVKSDWHMVNARLEFVITKNGHLNGKILSKGYFPFSKVVNILKIIVQKFTETQPSEHQYQSRRPGELHLQSTGNTRQELQMSQAQPVQSSQPVRREVTFHPST